MAAVIQSYHAILVEGRLPDWNGLIPAALAALLLCILGMRMFRKRSGEMVDEL